MQWVAQGGLTSVELPSSAASALAARMGKYADLPMDLADASLVWLAEPRSAGHHHLGSPRFRHLSHGPREVAPQCPGRHRPSTGKAGAFSLTEARVDFGSVQWLIIQGRLLGKALFPFAPVTVAPRRPVLQQPQPEGCFKRA